MTNIRKLSIYDPQLQPIMTSQQQVPHKPIIGESVMSLVSESREYYRNLIKSYSGLKDYSTSTEGKIKLGVMGGGLLVGSVLSFRSKSKSLLFRRFIPVGTLTIATAACFPPQAYHAATSVVTATWHGSVSAFNGSKKLYGYVASKLEKKENKAEEIEKTYVLGENGNLEVIEHTTDDACDVTSNNGGGEPELTSSVLKFLPGDEKDSVDSEKDFGQGKKEDKDLYTTR